MIDVLNLQYNGSTLNGVSFEGIPVETFIANEYKYQSSIAAEDLLKILYLPDNNSLQTSYEGVLNATGNTTFVGKIHDKVKSSEIATSGNVVKAMPLDDWGYLFYRYYEHNVWPGGGGTFFPINWGPSNFTLSYKAITTTMSFKGELNENQHMFFSGLYINKVIRVPYSFYSGNETLELFPATFDSSFFDSNYMPSVDIIEWEDDGSTKTYRYENGELVSSNPSSYPSKQLGDTLFTSLTIEKSGLQLNINYSIGATLSNTYRTLAVKIGDCLLHFVQEYPSSRRVYFGKEVDPLYTNDTNKSFLQTCGSFDIHVDNTDNGAIVTNNTRTLEAGTHVFVPANMLAAWEGWVVNTSPEVNLVNVGTFSWGWEDYTHFKPTDISQPYTLTLS